MPIHCSKCGAEANPQAVYCHKCGTRLPADESLFEAGSDQPQATFAANTSTPPTPSGLARSRRDAPEELLWEGTFSPKAMLGWWVADGLVTAGGIVLAVMLPAFLIFILAAIVIFSTTIALVLVYRRLSVSYKLTTQRLFHQYGLLSRTTDRIEVIDMDDISSYQGLVERLLGVGSIRVTSSDRTHPEFWLRGIENVQQVAILMDDARRNERVRRGFHIESV